MELQVKEYQAFTNQPSIFRVVEIVGETWFPWDRVFTSFEAAQDYADRCMAANKELWR